MRVTCRGLISGLLVCTMRRHSVPCDAREERSLLLRPRLLIDPKEKPTPCVPTHDARSEESNAMPRAGRSRVSCGPERLRGRPSRPPRPGVRSGKPTLGSAGATRATRWQAGGVDLVRCAWVTRHSEASRYSTMPGQDEPVPDRSWAGWVSSGRVGPWRGDAGVRWRGAGPGTHGPSQPHLRSPWQPYRSFGVTLVALVWKRRRRCRRE